MPKRKPSGGGGPTTPTPPPPDPPPAPEDSGVQGYARVAMVASGNAGGSLDVDHIHTAHPSATIYTVSTFSQLRSALEASGKRFIRVVGDSLLDGAGADLKISNPLFTVDGSAYTGPGMKDYKIVMKVGDQIWTQLAMRPSEGSTPAKSADRRAISFNPGNNEEVLSRVCLDHMSLAWGPDVVGSAINNVEDFTIQYSIIGPCLRQSNIKTSPNGYGWNDTVPGNSNPGLMYGKRITRYRCLHALNDQRNLKHEHTLGVDDVNNVVYGWGSQRPCHGNFRGGNIIGNIFKKSPDSNASDEAFEPENPSKYPQYPNSTYQTGNIGWESDETPYTLDWSRISGSALRASVYDGGPTDSDHGPLSVSTADAALFADVVVNAGRAFQDDTDADVKAHCIAGTSDGYYNGAGFPAPHPSWS
jgi:hypothetical protein